MCALVCLASPFPVWADWNDPNDVILGSAHTLEQNGFSMGLFSPLRYGILDNLQVSTHPILDLLLTPNIATRIRLHEGLVAVALQLGYQQTFLEERAAGFPGVVHGEVVVSVTPTRWLGLTVSSGYGWGFFPTEHHVPLTGTVHLLFERSHLVTLQVSGRYLASDGSWAQPNGMLTYAYGWHSFHLSGGVSVGRYAFLPWRDVELEVGGVPISPVLDLWWRF